MQPLWCLFLGILLGHAVAGPQIELCARAVALATFLVLSFGEAPRRRVWGLGLLLGLAGGLRLQAELHSLGQWDGFSGTACVMVARSTPQRTEVWLNAPELPPVRAVASSLHGIRAGSKARADLRSWLPKARRNPDDTDRLRAGLARPPILRVKFLRSPQWQEPANPREKGPREWLRQALRTRLKKTMGEGSALWSALLLGDRTDLSEGARARFRRLGLAHMLALSGLHVGLVALLLLRLSRRSRRKASGWILLPLGAWAVAAGLSPSLLRAVTILAWLIAGRSFGRRCRPVDGLAAAGILELLLRPESVVALGWWLSYAATLALLRVAEHLPRTRALAAMVAVTVAPLGTLPWTLGVFGRLPLAAPLWNLLLGPLFALLMGAGCLLVLAALLLPVTAPATLTILAICTHTFGYLLKLVAGLDPGGLGHPGLHGWAWILALGSVGLLLLPDLRFSFRRRLMVVGCLLLLVHARVLFAPGASWWSLDVGQGDAGVLRVGHGDCLVIDCGPGPWHGGPERVIVPYLSRRNLKGASLVLTHGHRDHYGGAIALLRSQRIRDLYLGVVERGRPWTGPILEAARRAQVTTHWIACGDSLKVGGWTLHCLWPSEAAASLSANNRSVVLRGGPDFAPILWTGDLEREAEAKLLARTPELHCEVLKVAHHGSKTGSSKALLERLSGSVALISCGVGNRYHHPHAATLQALRELGWRVLRTDRQGAVGLRWWVKSLEVRSVGPAP